MTSIEKAYAKINLYLNVLNHREDGYHDIASLMQTVGLCDIVKVTHIPNGKKITVKTNIPELPTDENNIAYRSAEEYLKYFKISSGVDIEIEKAIPIGAGLAGGSADGGATLRALNNIFKLANEDELVYIASKVGSDVPFCTVGGLCACGGRGDHMKRLPNIEKKHLVVAIGEHRVSTPKAYGELDKKYGNYKDHPLSEDSRAIYEAVFESHSIDPSKITPFNLFEEVIAIPEIAAIKAMMSDCGATDSLMSGSGPAVFGIFNDKLSAEKCKDVLLEYGYWAYECAMVYPEDNL